MEGVEWAITLPNILAVSEKLDKFAIEPTAAKVFEHVVPGVAGYGTFRKSDPPATRGRF